MSLYEARLRFSMAAIDCSRSEVLEETLKLLLDMMDVLEQSDECEPVIAAYEEMKEAMKKLEDSRAEQLEKKYGQG